MGGRGGLDVLVAIMTCVKQQSRGAFDAHIANPEEQRAGRLAVAFNPKQCPRLVVLAHHGIKTSELATHAVTCRAAGNGGGRKQYERARHYALRLVAPE